MGSPFGPKIDENLKKMTSGGVLENTSQKVIKNGVKLTPSRPRQLVFSLGKTPVRSFSQDHQKVHQMTSKWPPFGRPLGTKIIKHTSKEAV